MRREVVTFVFIMKTVSLKIISCNAFYIERYLLAVHVTRWFHYVVKFYHRWNSSNVSTLAYSLNGTKNQKVPTTNIR